MKLQTLSIALLWIVASVAAQDSLQPNHTLHFAIKDLDGIEKTLVADAQASGTAGKELWNAPLTRTGLRYRSKTATPEQHRDLTDVVWVKSGSATVQIGGELVEPKGTGTDGELTGTSIRGGEKFQASAGDIFNIPPGVPHQYFLEPGKTIAYYSVKVREKASTPGRANP